MEKTLFSGLRPSGRIHLGNYLGAIKNWVLMQETHHAIYSVVDLHGMTTPYDPSKRQEEIREVVIDYLAAGLDPDKCIIFVQSHVPEHVELAWILGSITPVSWLERVPTFKEKVEKHPDFVNLGLFSYPVLMAADILLYKAEEVPVGEDQVPHIELTRQIAKKFNTTFADLFPYPKPILSQGKRIMSLKHPDQKMSKTGDDGIALSDTPEEIKHKIKRAVTDTGDNTQTKSPGVANLFTLLAEFSKPSTFAEFQDAHNKGDLKYSDLKETLAKDIADYFAPFREKRAELLENPKKVDDILEKGTTEARRIAEKNMREIRKACGLR
ncbi:tryptophan--tRNA ligase [Patescibacteria group bacterium]|nr:tryptophan--tRNA ligase [Patescibacteria group bacterium]